VEAQAAMQETIIVKAHPEWSDGPNRLLSKPGQGGHPRGMAVDVAVEDIATSQAWDMGTVFDTMTVQSARGYTGFPAHILENRQKLEKAFTDGAVSLNLPLLPLPSEWWDFRFPASYSETYAPLSDIDLPDNIRMTP
jgi:D-alanyl-D-alanine dipeptidase